MKKVKAYADEDSPISEADVAESKNQAVASTNVQWQLGAGKTYYPCARTIQKLPAGVYTAHSSMQGPYLQAASLQTDDLLRFEDPTHKAILGEIDDFWGLKEQYKSMGFLHNRAILMHGPPGSGKTCISKIVIDDVINRGNIVINCTSLYDFLGPVKAFREVEPERQILIAMEDVDSIGGQSKLLPLLDGEDSLNNVMYLATTNYIHKIQDRLMRPGRFDRKINVPCPPIAGRTAFLENKLGKENPMVTTLAEATEGLSFAHMRELLIGIYCLKQPVESVINRLRNKGVERLSGEKPSEVYKDVPEPQLIKTISAQTNKVFKINMNKIAGRSRHTVTAALVSIAGKVEINTGSSAELLEACKKKFGNGKFKIEGVIGLLKGFNHAQRYVAMLEALVKEGKIELSDKGDYKVAETVSIESYARNFITSRKIKQINKVKLVIALENQFGELVAPKTKLIASIRELVPFMQRQKFVATAAADNKCPRCGTVMTKVELANGIQAMFCKNDRVTIPVV